MTDTPTATIRTVAGAPDDVTITGDTLRLEQMDDGEWWLAIYRGNQRVCFFLTSDTPITCVVSEDSLGCEYREGNDDDE